MDSKSLFFDPYVGKNFGPSLLGKRILAVGASYCRWISEGGLEPAFKNEGTTWTDAILGDVEIKQGKKRGVGIVDAKMPVGVVIVEAKLGSELADGVTNSKEL